MAFIFAWGVFPVGRFNYIYVGFLEVVSDAALSVKAREESQFTARGAGCGWGRGVRTFKVRT
jgi:hypothetical protein